MEPPKCYVVISDNQFHPTYKLEEYKNLDPNLKCLFWVRLTETGEISHTQTPNDYTKYYYDLFTSNGRNAILSNKGWKILKIQDSSFKNSFEPGSGIFTDPWGKERQISLVQMDEGKALEAHYLLEMYSEYDSWETYDIKMEMEQLKLELDKLKKIVENLKP